MRRVEIVGHRRKIVPLPLSQRFGMVGQRKDVQERLIPRKGV